VLLFVLCAAPSTAAAQQWNPEAAVLAYSAALNAHDLDSALALFDEYGSATDGSGRHFEGRAGLTEFLLANGFGNSSSRVTTQGLQIVANRAVWTYACSCTAGSTEVRLVLNHNKISVFAVMPAPAAPVQKADAGILPWMVGLGLVAGALAGGLQFGLRRGRSVAAPPRPSQGRLLAALVAYRPGGADSDRVELPAAAITSLSDSEDRAGPCSRYRKHEAARPGSRWKSGGGL
jgi:hypothetical protein